MSQKLQAAGLSIIVNLTLLTAKVLVAAASGSVGLLAEVLHSGLDLAASALAYAGIRKAMQPPDSTHAYGHHRFENISALAQVLLIVATALFVTFEAVERLLHPQAIGQTTLGIAVMAIALATAWYTARRLHETASKEHSSALEADAYHFTTDVYSGIAVLAGLALSHFGLPIADPLAAIAVAAIMLHGSAELGKKAIMILTDATPQEIIDTVEEIASREKNVTSFHKVRARQSGSRLFVDMHVRLAPRTPLAKAHLISHGLKKKIMAADGRIEDVNIHVEPEGQAGKNVKRY